MTLEQLRPGERARVVAVGGGYGLQRRLARLGIHPGDTVRVCSRGAFRGPVLLDVQGSQIAVGHGIARRVAVERLPGSPTGRGGR